MQNGNKGLSNSQNNRLLSLLNFVVSKNCLLLFKSVYSGSGESVFISKNPIR